MPRKSTGRRRGVYFPSLFTVANVFCGFYSIISTFRGDYGFAAALIGWCIVLDTLDGRVARFANATSDFGKEFDSLADQVSFGVAPAILVYAWSLYQWPRMGWLLCFLFVICGAVRLARFNTQHSTADKRFFVGLPIPAGAGMLAALIFRFPNQLSDRAQSVPVLFLVLVLSLLMVSRLRYYSFKDLDIRRRQPSLSIVFLALVLVTVFMQPQAMLLAMASVYLASGLVLKLFPVTTPETSSSAVGEGGDAKLGSAEADESTHKA